jgi:hypothetical protein
MVALFALRLVCPTRHDAEEELSNTSDRFAQV